MPRVYSKVWDDKVEFDKWKKRIDFMEKYFKNAEQRHDWKKYISFLWGNAKTSLGLSHAVVNVNEIFAYVKTMVAGLYARDPYLTVNPTKNLEIQGAIIKEQSINYLWRQLKMKRQIKRCIPEACVVGHAWVKVGYTAEIGEEFVSSTADETNEFISGESKWATYIPYNSVYFDPDAIDAPYDCRWIEHHYLKPIDVIKAKYKLPPDVEIKPENDYARQKPEKDMSELPDEPNDKTMVHEVWDKDSGRKLVFCDGYDDWLENIVPRDENCIGPYQMEGFPFVMLKFNDFTISEGKDNFPMSDVEAWEDQYIEKVKFRSQQINHVKRFNRQLISKKGNIEQKEMEKLTQGTDGAIIEVQNVTDTIPIPYPQLQTDIYMLENKLDSDRDRISGQSQMDQGGEASTQTKTLGEVNQVQQATGNRKLERVDIIGDFCVEIATKLLQLSKQFDDIEQTVRITGNIPDTYLQTLTAQKKYDGMSIVYTKDDIQGKEDVSMEFGSTTPLDKNQRLQNLIMVAKVGPAFGLTPQSLASLELGKMIMKDYGLLEVELAYEQDINNLMKAKQQPNPIEQLKTAQIKQSLQKGAVDTQLKSQRTVAVQLGNVKKAAQNIPILKGNTQQPAPVATGHPEGQLPK